MMLRDPFYEYYRTRAGYVELRLRLPAAAVTLVLLSAFCWAVLYAVARFL